jgi:hypothetical protein
MSLAKTFPHSIARLRETVQTRVRASSLRAVAREVGMSPSGLEKFLSGGNPYSGTRRKLYNWWLRSQGEPTVPRLSSEAADGALRLLLQDVAPERRDEILAELVRTLRDLHHAHGELCPPWLAELVGDPHAGWSPWEGAARRAG